MLQLSHSRVKLWRKCRRAHWYRYVRRLKRRRKERPLYVGSVGHDCLAALTGRRSIAPVLYEYREKLKKELFIEERPEYEEMIDQARDMVNGYRQFWKNDGLRYPRFNKRTSEHPIEVVLRDPATGMKVKVLGYLDALPRDRSGRLFIMEHKFMKQVPPEEARMWDVQTVLYRSWMTKAGYPKPNGVIWDYIRTKVPTKPQVLKKGGLSKRSNIDTTEEVYRAAILEQGLDPSEYEEFIKEHLEGREATFFRRITLPFSRQLVHEVERDFWETVYDMAHHHETARARTMDQHCGWCEYRDLCYAELRGTDTERLLRREYRRREDAETKEESSNVEG